MGITGGVGGIWALNTIKHTRKKREERKKMDLLKDKRVRHDGSRVKCLEVGSDGDADPWWWLVGERARMNDDGECDKKVGRGRGKMQGGPEMGDYDYRNVRGRGRMGRMRTTKRRTQEHYNITHDEKKRLEAQKKGGKEEGEGGTQPCTSP